MTVMATPLAVETIGGVPVASAGSPAGGQVAEAGQLQYGRMLLGVGTTARWRTLTGWRGLPGADLSDSARPQAHGTYPGDIYGTAQVVTFDCLVTGTPADKLAALDTIEAHTRMDGVERALVVDDGAGPWLRMGRVVAREVPMELHYRHAPVPVSVQWSCADPRRYSLWDQRLVLTLPSSSGGLEYPLTYPLSYGTFSVGSSSARNLGTEDTPVVATFRGPLLDPVLTTSTWRLGFNINLAAGESLTVDTAEGTALLNGSTDRLYLITTQSDPIERCLLPPGVTDVALTAADGDGQLDLTYRHARM